MVTGRPSLYTPELAAELCKRLALGKSLRTVCKDDDMPGITTVFNWLHTHEDFVKQYARAKEEAADALVDEMLDIADDSSDEPQSRRVRVDTRKWIASKLKPKRYGDKIDMTTNGKDLPAPILGGAAHVSNDNSGQEAAETPQTD
jgi:hypothetical protein